MRQHELTLNKLWFYIQPTLSTMAMVAEVCRNCETMGARGGKTLSLLHQLLMCQTGNENCKAVAEFLVKAAAKPYFEILSRWIHRGMISDSGKDFFVEDNEVIDRTILPLEYSDDYWERRYTLRMDQIPAFLHSSSDMILRTGEGFFCYCGRVGINCPVLSRDKWDLLSIRNKYLVKNGIKMIVFSTNESYSECI